MGGDNLPRSLTSMYVPGYEDILVKKLENMGGGGVHSCTVRIEQESWQIKRINIHVTLYFYRKRLIVTNAGR